MRNQGGQDIVADHLVEAAVLVEGGLGIAALSLGWVFEVNPIASLAWSWGGAIGGVAGALPMLALFFMIDWLPLPPFERIRRLLETHFLPSLRSASTIELVLVCVAAGMGEEIFFRGLLYPLLRPLLSGPIVILLACLLFGLAHAITLTYFLFATGVAAYCFWLWFATGNLLAPIVAHAAYDFVAIEYLLRQAARPADTETSEASP